MCYCGIMPDKLGARIARYRAQLGWTQQALAERLAVSRTAVSHFEIDLAVPSERTVVLLAGLFKVEPHELVADTYYPPAKADRLPPVAARYTAAEHALLLLAHDAAWLARLAAHPAGARLAAELRDSWRDRLAALLPTLADPAEYQRVAAALRDLERTLRR